GGPAGIACAIWLKRLGLLPKIFERHHLGGQLHDITLPLQDVPGFYGANVSVLLADLVQQLHQMGIDVYEEHDVVAFDEAVVYAPGLRTRDLKVPGAQWVTSLSTSALLAQPLAGEVLIVGGGDRAFEAALRLSEAGKSVCLIHRRDHFRARPDFQQRVRDLGIVVHVNTTVEAITPTQGGVEVVLKGPRTTKRVKAAVVMVRIGMEPDIQPGLCSSVLSDVVPLWPSSRLRVIGDAVTPVPFRSIVTAFASGMVAAKEMVMNPPWRS
ncbi:MAG: NAD(P)/FAD-dependent oxidoreductase, partial [Sulfobacillus thermotolerans]|nr:NAD(P)/FAD-dependent oxidoreductase [Sulfobacillus thermotolerans]